MDRSTGRLTIEEVVAALAGEWGLELGRVLQKGCTFVVAARTQSGEDVVLKVFGPDPDAAREGMALRAYGGAAACRLVREDPTRRALLLERVQPGDQLSELARTDDDAATRIGARLMRRLWQDGAHILADSSRAANSEAPSASAFRPLEEWFRAFEQHRASFDGGSGPIPGDLLDRAERLAAELLASVPRIVLLHGDFHHFNVLRSEGAGWLAIDPKGMLGDPGYEAGPFMCNPYPVSTAVLARRLDIFAEELDYDRQRLCAWAIAHALLSVCWYAEDDHQGLGRVLGIAQRLDDLLA